MLIPTRKPASFPKEAAVSSGKAWTIYRFDLNTMRAQILKHQWFQHVGEIDDECKKLNKFAVEKGFDMFYMYGDYHKPESIKNIPTLDEWHRNHSPL